MKKRLYIYDCLTCKLRVSEQTFMTIGKAEDCTFRVAMQIPVAGVFAHRNGHCHFFPKEALGTYSLNGVELTEGYKISTGTYCLMVLAGGCFVAWYGEDSNKPDFAAFRPRTWYVYSQRSAAWTPGMSIEQLLELPEDECREMMTTFDGLGSYVFLLQDILKVAEFAVSNGLSKPESAHSAEHLHRCPTCCSAFTTEEILSIAVHPQLQGDSKLGPDEMLRFKPTSISSEGEIYDQMGARCSEQACPFCHHKLPPFFKEMRQHIFPIIGVPASGKSYYLTTLVQELERRLPMEFGVPFRDADPAANKALNEVRQRVFTANSPREAYIGKTSMDGHLYQQVYMNGATQLMPRPFIYTLDKGSVAHSVVLYDNAGESFEPTSGETSAVSTDYLKVADGLLFLFDPTTNPGFRALLKGVQDPQIEHSLYPPGRQSSLLAETERRLRTALQLPPGRKVNTPLALIIGKSDCWQHLLGPEPLLSTVRDGRVCMENIEANSARLRELLFRIAPQICVNAEAISERVRYFAASSLGQAPIMFTDETTGATLMGPGDANLSPSHVTDSLIWMLNTYAPELLQPATN